MVDQDEMGPFMRLSRWFIGFFLSGIPHAEDLEVRRKIIMGRALIFIGIGIGVSLGMADFFEGNYYLGLLLFAISGLWIADLLYFRITKNLRVAINFGVLFTGGLLFCVSVTGGVGDTGYIWIFIFPLVATLLLGSRKGAIATLILFVPLFLYLMLDQYLQFFPRLALYPFDLKIRIIFLFLAVFAFAYLFEYIREKTQRELVFKNEELRRTVEYLRWTQDDLRRARDEMEKRVEERTLALQKMNEQLILEMEERQRVEAKLVHAQKMEAIGTLAGAVAHDLNNILSGIVTYPELLLQTLPEESPLKKPLTVIQTSGERAAAVVQDLLTMARREVAVRDVVNLNNVIADYLVSPEHERLMDAHPHIRMVTHLDRQLLNLSGSRPHLSKVVMNLVTNAADAIPSAGTITITTENRYVDRPIIHYDRVEEGDYVTMTVSDTGKGISKEDLERIFEPFHTTKKMGRSGSGLGLAVVYGTVHDHNGYIDVQSMEGQGASFSLYFPVTREKLAKDQPRFSIEDYRGRGEMVLVVDDVEEQRVVASLMLEQLGYRSVAVSSGEEAVRYLQTCSVDLILLDMVMAPGMDGLDTYREIVKRHPGQKAVIASGFSETDRVRDAQRLGAGAYIRKPYLIQHVAVVIRNELDRGKQRRP